MLGFKGLTSRQRLEYVLVLVASVILAFMLGACVLIAVDELPDYVRWAREEGPGYLEWAQEQLRSIWEWFNS